MLKIGITGGIGSGKSYVCQKFEKLGLPIFYSDIEAKKIMVSDNIKPELIRLLGQEVFINGDLNKPYIRNLIFNNKELLSKLNILLKKHIKIKFDEWCSKQDSEYVLYESALIYESNSAKDFDKIILVSAPTDIRYERVKKRDNLTKEEFSNILRNQNQYEIESDFFIYNDGQMNIDLSVETINKKILNG